MPQLPTNWDLPNPQKMLTLVYDAQFLLGTVPVSGSVSSTYDLSSWTQFAIQSVPNGTILGGTVMNFWGAKSADSAFYPLYGTNNVAYAVNFGSTTNQILTPLTFPEPVRFLQIVLGGTQSAAQTFTLLVK